MSKMESERMTPTAFAAHLRAVIRAHRRARRLSQAAMAERLAVCPTAYRYWETGRVHLHVDDLAAIAAVLGVRVAALVGEAENQEREEGEG